ncbi:MAG: AbrB family transcriptional regulator [Pseudomonadota bacterium]
MIVRATARFVLTFLIAIAGGLAFMALGLPVAFLSGAAIATGGAAIAGLNVALPAWLRQLALIFLGVTMGSAIRPETFSLMARWPLSLAVLMVCVVGVMAGIAAYLVRVHRFDVASARLSAIPGALPYVLALAEESRGDPRRVTILQLARLLMLVVFMPSLITAMGGAAPALPEASAPARWLELALVFAAGFAGSLAFQALRVPAGAMFGAMAAGAIAFGSGAITSGIPPWLLVVGYLVMGTVLGANFAGTNAKLLLQTAVASVGSVALAAMIALAFAAPTAWAMGLPVAQLWLAFAPGGVETMAILALALGLDPAFVGAHHAVRFVALGVIAPLWMRGHLRASR